MLLLLSLAMTFTLNKLIKFVLQLDYLLEHRTIVLVTPYQYLGYLAQCFHQKGLILFRDNTILGHNIAQVPQMFQRERILWL